METKYNLNDQVFTVTKATPNTMPRICGPFKVAEINLTGGSQTNFKEFCALSKGTFGNEPERKHRYLAATRLFKTLNEAQDELMYQLRVRAKTL